MKNILLLPLLILAGCAQPPAEPVTPDHNQAPEGYAALFNGIDLEGWYGHGTEDPRVLWAMTPEALEIHKDSTRANIRKHWSVDNGELVNDGEGLYLTTNEDYADFELLLEYKTVPGADSGIYLRGVPQVQIWDTTEEGGKWDLGADKGSGGLWNNSPGAPGKDPLVAMDRPFGEWNTFRIIMREDRVSIWLNGTSVVDNAVMENYFDRSIPIFERGPIQLQTHGGEIRWRNIFIKDLSGS
ncbi:MAG: 3-keto-disaccharide hydrolase [Rhodothermales bacterium]